MFVLDSLAAVDKQVGNNCTAKLKEPGASGLRQTWINSLDLFIMSLHSL